jgi:hypothetical protein
LFINLNALFILSNIIPQGMIQSTKFLLPSLGTREIKGCLVSPQVNLGQKRGDVSQFEKPEIGK